jgi:hypothetical protein
MAGQSLKVSGAQTEAVDGRQLAWVFPEEHDRFVVIEPLEVAHGVAV